LSENELLI